jgi:hypothetical protein
MNGRREPLGDVLALALAEHGPTGAERLAGVVHRRKGDVLATLRTDARFVRIGRGNRVRWWFNVNAAEARKDRQRGNLRPEVGIADTPARPDRWQALAAARKAARERRYGQEGPGT